MKPVTLPFTFTLDPADRTWTVTTSSGPGAYGIHAEPYEALMECAFVLFDYIEKPLTAQKSAQPLFHQLNLDFYPYFEDTVEEEEIEERVLSPEQLERARLFAEALKNE